MQGNVACGAQNHFHLEQQTCATELRESGGMVINSSTQAPDNTLRLVSQVRAAPVAPGAALHCRLLQPARRLVTSCLRVQVTGLPMGKLRVQTHRMGGAYGGKITNSLPIVRPRCCRGVWIVSLRVIASPAPFVL